MSELSVSVNRHDHVQGPANAPVTLVEYSDYECRESGDAHIVTKQVQALMGNRLRFVFRHFPLSELHPYAVPAALVAESAARQGKFWEMHNLLFAHQEKLGHESFIGYAEMLHLDIPQFMEGLESEEVAHKIRDDFVSGLQSGVRRTPTFYINGLKYRGSYELDQCMLAIQDATRKSALIHEHAFLSRR